MTKVTLSVCKVFKNTGRLRFHREKTRKHWKHYFIDLDDGKFRTEWVNPIKAQFLKTQKRKLLYFICTECGLIFRGLVKKSTDTCECPECED